MGSQRYGADRDARQEYRESSNQADESRVTDLHLVPPYARPFRDAEDRNNVRISLASIGFGTAPVDQSVDQDEISGDPVA